MTTVFEALDDSCFDDVAGTYGAATSAPARLRALADEDPRVAYEALYWIQADYFHQDLFEEVTPLVVPYLLEVARAPLPAQSEVIELLGRMLRGGTYFAHEFVPYISREDPRHRDTLGSDTPPDAHELRTRRAIAQAEPMFVALLDAPDPEVRCMAIWTCAAFGPSARAPIAARLAVEPDVQVRVYARIALSTLEPTCSSTTFAAIDGQDDADGTLEADLVAVLEASVPIDEATGRAFTRLLAAPKVEWLRFAEGQVDRIAVHHLRRLGPTEPRLLSIFQRAFEAGADTSADLAALACELLFPAGVPRHARELTEPQRWALRTIHVGEARGVKLDDGDLAGQRAFVDGDGPLDDVVTFRGRTGTVAELLLAHPDEAEALLAARARDLPEARVFELATSITRGDLGYKTFWDVAVRTCAGSVTLERTLAYLASCRELDPTRHRTEGEADLLLAPYLAPYLAPPSPSPEALDPIVTRRLYFSDQSTLRDWLRTFSPSRRAALVGQLQGDVVDLASLCDRQLLGEVVFARFLSSPSYTVPLRNVPSPLLRARASTVSDEAKRGLVEEELAAREARTELRLCAGKILAMELELRLDDNQRLVRLELDRLREASDLALFLEVLRESSRATLTVDASVPAWIVEVLRGELGERVRLAT